jgi:asparagine synthase (glutamine-hydrolysing)
MPGLTVWRPVEPVPDDGDRFLRALTLQVRAANDKAVIDFDRPSLHVGHAGYPGYPVRTWVDGDLTIVFEGHIYGLDDNSIRDRLQAVARKTLTAATPAPSVAEFVGETDGEFVAVIASSLGDRCLLFTDALGRLPLYVHQGPSGVAVSREAKCIADLARGWAFDPIGLAQTLWLGYPLAERTLFQDIVRAPGGFLLDSRSEGERTTWTTAATYAYRCDHAGGRLDVDVAAAGLAEQFVIAAKARAAVAGEAPVIVSLSGGNDSRSVLAALRGERGVVAATFIRNGGIGAADVTVARQVAASFDVPWYGLELSEPSPADEERLVWLKDGLNHVGMAFILSFLDSITERWSDRSVLLTGDGGDKALPDLRPSRQLRSTDDLMQGLLDDAEISPAETVEAAVGLPPGSLVAELRRLLDAYPEATLDGKAVRFQLAERGRKWLFEGEDRGRGSVWQTSPFYALPVFESAIALPPQLKVDYQLYVAFQRHLDKRLLSIPHADFGISIDSGRYRARARLRRIALRDLGIVVRPMLQRRRRRGIGPSPARADAQAGLAAMQSAGSRLLQTLNPDAAARAIESSGAAALESWRTILLVDRLWGKRLA